MAETDAPPAGFPPPAGRDASPDPPVSLEIAAPVPPRHSELPKGA